MSLVQVPCGSWDTSAGKDPESWTRLPCRHHTEGLESLRLMAASIAGTDELVYLGIYGPHRDEPWPAHVWANDLKWQGADPEVTVPASWATAQDIDSLPAPEYRPITGPSAPFPLRSELAADRPVEVDDRLPVPPPEITALETMRQGWDQWPRSVEMIRKAAVGWEVRIGFSRGYKRHGNSRTEFDLLDMIGLWAHRPGAPRVAFFWERLPDGANKWAAAGAQQSGPNGVVLMGHAQAKALLRWR